MRDRRLGAPGSESGLPKLRGVSGAGLSQGPAAAGFDPRLQVELAAAAAVTSLGSLDARPARRAACAHRAASFEFCLRMRGVQP